jgi:hypothetical protein
MGSSSEVVEVAEERTEGAREGAEDDEDVDESDKKPGLDDIEGVVSRNGPFVRRCRDIF